MNPQSEEKPITTAALVVVSAAISSLALACGIIWVARHCISNYLGH
jgi:hypothetical protein